MLVTGAACRNQCVVRELKWDLTKRTVSLTVESKVNQTINVRIRKGIDYEATNDFVNGPINRIDANTAALKLTAGQAMTRVFQFEDSADASKTNTRRAPKIAFRSREIIAASTSFAGAKGGSGNVRFCWPVHRNYAAAIDCVEELSRSDGD